MNRKQNYRNKTNEIRLNAEEIWQKHCNQMDGTCAQQMGQSRLIPKIQNCELPVNDESTIRNHTGSNKGQVATHNSNCKTLVNETCYVWCHMSDQPWIEQRTTGQSARNSLILYVCSKVARYKSLHKGRPGYSVANPATTPQRYANHSNELASGDTVHTYTKYKINATL